MKEIKNYHASKYDTEAYKELEEGIYETMDEDDEALYVTSLSFVQEPELSEGESAADISQYPLEDLLDKFYCHISDFYEELNSEDSQVCYQEFASPELVDVQNLRSIIGKHVYNKEEGDMVKLVIE
ncbi:MAG: hypothetical protein IJZ82_09100 [Lachnospiraceae bacterium]|nr:hypothetical protein [Lachnospiraceae bacterium]